MKKELKDLIVGYLYACGVPEWLEEDTLRSAIENAESEYSKENEKENDKGMKFLEHLKRTGLIFDDDIPGIIINNYFLEGKNLTDLETDIYAAYDNEEIAEEVYESFLSILEDSWDTVKRELRARQIEAIEKDIINWNDDPDDGSYIIIHMSYGDLRVIKCFTDGFYSLNKHNLARYIYQCIIR